MSDTSPEIHQKQLEVIFLKTPEERFIIGAELTDLCREIVENSIRQQNPDISEIDLKVEVFKRYYSKEFSPEELNKIIKSFREYHKER